MRIVAALTRNLLAGGDLRISIDFGCPKVATRHFLLRTKHKDRDRDGDGDAKLEGGQHTRVQKKSHPRRSEHGMTRNDTG